MTGTRTTRDGQTKARHRIARAAAITGIAALALVGCSPRPYTPSARETIPHFPESGGQLLSEFVSHVESIDGISVERASISDLPNVKENTGFEMHIVLDPEYVIANPEAFVNYLVLSAWSVRDGYQPNTDLSFSISVKPYDAFDLRAAMYEAGWYDKPPVSKPTPGKLNMGKVQLSDDFGPHGLVNLERLGDWPGDVPDMPEGMVVKK